jgi:hypothetical protein
MSLSQRTEMRRCGRRWATEDQARCSKRGLREDAAVLPCPVCEGFHVVLPKPEAARKATAAPKGIAGFPERIRKAAIERDGGCVGCSDDRSLDVHHRRIRGHGGDKRAHAQCLCNAICLCRLEHRAAHLAGRREAEAKGWVVSREVILPGSVSVMLFGSGGGGVSMFPTCDGQWSTVAAVAA